MQMIKKQTRASLVAQWLRIRLPMQGTRVQVLVWEDPTCRRATKPVSHNYWACTLQPTSHNYWAHVPQLLKTACLPQWEACAPQRRVAPTHRNQRKAHMQQWRPNTAKKKKKKQTKFSINFIFSASVVTTCNHFVNL